MIDREECWQNARDCEAWAQLISNNGDRQHFLAMATYWTRLALGQEAPKADAGNERQDGTVMLFARRA
jgi:hypothetical protein